MSEFPYGRSGLVFIFAAMQSIKWFAILVILLVAACCFFPWVTIPEKNITISGFHSDISIFGKPGIMHFFICGLLLLLLLFQKSWSLRAGFFISFINIAWAFRNYFLISSCRAGTCPEKQPALYTLLVGSLVLTVLILFVPSRSKIKNFPPEEPVSSMDDRS
jgi:hypothetical protein